MVGWASGTSARSEIMASRVIADTRSCARRTTFDGYNGQGEMTCNSDKNECRFPCSVYGRRDNPMSASNKGRGKAAAHLDQESGDPAKYAAISPVGQLQAETIGLTRFPGLWIFCRIKNLDERGLSTARLTVNARSSPFVIASFINCFVVIHGEITV